MIMLQGELNLNEDDRSMIHSAAVAVVVDRRRPEHRPWIEFVYYCYVVILNKNLSVCTYVRVVVYAVIRLHLSVCTYVRVYMCV